MKYSKLVEVYKKLEATTKRLEKTSIVAKAIKSSFVEGLDEICYLLQGKVFPPWDERKIGISSKLAMKAISTATGTSKAKIESLLRKTGDLGIIAEELVKNKKQTTFSQKELTVEKVFNNIRKAAELEGPGTVGRKVQLVVELLTSAKPIEARFIIRTVLEELRIGVAEGILRDAISEAYKIDVNLVENAFNLLVDYAEVAKLAKQNKLKKVSLIPGRPIKLMLAILVKDVNEGFERVNKPAEIEFKYDGVRLEIHKKANEIKLFTRRMEDVTKQFPEIVQYVKDSVKGNSFILDSEAVGFNPKTGKYLPFQQISQRIKRKYNIQEMAKKFPVDVNIFDIVYHNGKTLFGKKFKERRKLLEKIIREKTRKILLAENLITDSIKEAEKFYKNALDGGNEGIMLKNLNAEYKPGRYVGYMCKLKPVMETLDLIIVGAEWGEGKRAKWLSSFTLACKKGVKFLEIGKVGTGIKEKAEGVTFKKLTEELKPLIQKQEGKHVFIKPKLVVEIAYEEIQKSPTYASGYALRFPKLLKIRYDKGLDDCDNIKRITKLYTSQRGR